MILLTHGYFLHEDPKELEIMKPYAPLGILSIASWLRMRELPCEVFDSTFSSAEILQQHLLARPPRLLGIYVNLMTKLNVLKIVSFVRQNLPSCKVVLGGPEIRHYHEEYLKYGADMVVIGEGELTMEELCTHFIREGALPETAAGTAYMHQGAVVMNQERDLLKNIDLLPLPGRDMIDMNPYLNTWKNFHRRSMLSISTMRGCPYTCKWCSRAVYGGTYRRRSPRMVALEMLELKRTFSPDAIWFVDDVFTISHKWLREFAEQVKLYNAVIPYEIITRADRMNEEVVQLLKESGCFRVWIGAESGSQRIIDNMDRRVAVEQVRRMILLARGAGIETGTFIMLGYPGETTNDIRATIKHLQQSRPDHYTVTIAYPIKGTPLYDEIKNKLKGTFEFSQNTDRDLDFKRTHSMRYYRYALRWVHNEVWSQREQGSLKRLKMRLKGGIARLMMAASA